MIEVDVPGWRHLRLEMLVLDVNGVLTLDGELLPDVDDRLSALQTDLSIYLLTADTHGRLDDLRARLGVDGVRLRRDESEVTQKATFVRQMGCDRVVAIGNGANDVGMLAEAGLGIAVLGSEGLAASALTASDLVVSSVHDALALLSHPKRIIAGLRR